jgi:hypothetical protein
MKKSVFLLVAGIICVSVALKASEADYIITAEGVTYYEKVRYGITTGLIGVSESGRVGYPAGEVVSFSKNGKVYERMPVIRNNSETGRYAFIELVAYRSGMKVYRNKLHGSPGDLPDYELLVFQNDRFIVKFDEKNSENLKKFFFRPEASLAAK